jgi:uncharacterized paraquat-inducible protein A
MKTLIAMRNQRAAWCPTCEMHTEQSIIEKRKSRYCHSCGNTFTFVESRKSYADYRAKNVTPAPAPVQ